jgi:hypothetical protein
MVEATTDDGSTEYEQQKNTYPDPPQVKKVESVGVSVDSPREIRVTVTYWPRGHDSRMESTVRFSCRGMTAEIRDISGEGNWSEQLAAAVKAQKVIQDHPEIGGVAGVTELFSSEKQWIVECERNAGDEEE